MFLWTRKLQFQQPCRNTFAQSKEAFQKNVFSQKNTPLYKQCSSDNHAKIFSFKI